MREHFKDVPFRKSSLATIAQANDIIDEYQADGLKLTLRQLYYQFVSRGLIPNNQKAYDSLGRTVSNGRLAGLIDWDAIEDRTRFLRGVQSWSSPAALIRYNSRAYSIDMWQGQDVRLEVWIEKDALVGVIERVCRDNDVDYFACRGYVSQSELYEAGKRLRTYMEAGQSVVVIHLGDHDPSGLDMTRDNEERLRMFSGADDDYGCEGQTLEVKRIALNIDQVRAYDPPPNPAKLTDSRAQDYIAEHGAYSWELDALEPRVLRDLIQDEIDLVRDPDVWAEREELLAKHKGILRDATKFAEEHDDA